jgi:hypothetical protein
LVIRKKERGKWEARKLQRSDIFVEIKEVRQQSSAGKAKQGTKLISDEINPNSKYSSIKRIFKTLFVWETLVVL